MLSEMSSNEISEWRAYFNLKAKQIQQQTDKNAEQAKVRASENNQ